MATVPIDQTIERGTEFGSFVHPYKIPDKHGAGNLVQQTVRIVKTVALLQHQLNTLYWHACKSNQHEIYTQCRIAVTVQFESLLRKTKA